MTGTHVMCDFSNLRKRPLVRTLVQYSVSLSHVSASPELVLNNRYFKITLLHNVFMYGDIKVCRSG